MARGMIIHKYIMILIQHDKVNLVITDIEMPEMDGHRLTKLIKDDEHLKKIPVIIFLFLINDR